MFDMPSNEYIIIEDEQSVYDCTNKLGKICDTAISSTSEIVDLIQQKHELLTQAKILSDSLINELKMLNQYMGKGANIPRQTVRRIRPVQKVKKKMVIRHKVKSRRTVAKRKTSKKSMKGLQANLRKINKALK
jgi:predicted metal-dependent hydrolase